MGLGRVLDDFGRIFGGFFGVADHLLTLILLLWDKGGGCGRIREDFGNCRPLVDSYFVYVG